MRSTPTPHNSGHRCRLFAGRTLPFLPPVFLLHLHVRRARHRLRHVQPSFEAPLFDFSTMTSVSISHLLCELSCSSPLATGIRRVIILRLGTARLAEATQPLVSSSNTALQYCVIVPRWVARCHRCWKPRPIPRRTFTSHSHSSDPLTSR